MLRNKKQIYTALTCFSLALSACSIPGAVRKTENKTVPVSYNNTTDTANIAAIKWNGFFADPNLAALIDTALKNNQELNIVLQEIEISRNEVRIRKGEYLPFMSLKGAAGVEKNGRYTNIGAMEANTQIEPGKEMPEPMPDYLIGAYANWEVDIWRKLRNSKKAAFNRYLASVEGRNFVITTLIAEIANSYYELLALDNELKIVQQNIDIQSNALEIVKLQKSAARVTELAVRKFEAEVLKTKSLQYGIQQQIVETENKINFLLARYPQPIARNTDVFSKPVMDNITAGIPSQLLANRPDIRKAELQLAAAKLDVKSAKAEFYPSLRLTASVGYQAFNPSYIIKSPESLIYSLAGDLVAPLINRNAIKARYQTANAKQVQAIYEYERSILNGYVEVVNQLSKISNLQKSYDLQNGQVDALTQSIQISNDLFRSARADYMEVLLTQRDALESKFELVETRKKQLNAMVNVYQALGGGWK